MRAGARDESSKEIYFNAVGLSYLDVALAFNFFEKARRGTHMHLQMHQESIFAAPSAHIIL